MGPKVSPYRQKKGDSPSPGRRKRFRPRFIKYGLIEAEYKGRAGLHAFRHSLATVLITEENVDPKTAQGILRHASSDITMDIYTHAQDEAKRKALEKYESRLLQHAGEGTAARLLVGRVQPITQITVNTGRKSQVEN